MGFAFSCSSFPCQCFWARFQFFLQVGRSIWHAVKFIVGSCFLFVVISEYGDGLALDCGKVRNWKEKTKLGVIFFFKNPPQMKCTLRSLSLHSPYTPLCATTSPPPSSSIESRVWIHHQPWRFNDTLLHKPLATEK